MTATCVRRHAKVALFSTFVVGVAACDPADAELAARRAAVSPLTCGLPVVEAPQALPRDPCRTGTILLGPHRITRNRGVPAEASFRLSVPAAQPICIVVTSGDQDGRHRVASAKIALDGDVVIGPDRFNQQTTTIEERLVALAGEHRVHARVSSQPGTWIEVTIKGGGDGERHGLVATRHLALFNLFADPPVLSSRQVASRLSGEGLVARFAGLPTRLHTYTVAWTFEVRNSATCEQVRALNGSVSLLLPSTFTAVATWDGRSDAGTPVPDGRYAYRLVASLLRQDAAGDRIVDSLATAQQEIMVDRTAPEIVFIAPPAQGFVNTAEVPIDIALHDNLTSIDVGSIEILVDGVEVTSQLTLDAARITGTVTLADGPHTLGVRLRDRAGNPAAAELSFVVDTVPPVITVASIVPPANTHGWNNTSVTVAFACDDATSGIAICPAPVLVDGEGADIRVIAVAEDRAGNRNTLEVLVHIDKTPPVLTVLTPVDGATVNAPEVDVAGTLGETLAGIAAVTCAGRPAAINDTSFACRVPLVLGANAITVRADDRAGNAAVTTINVNSDYVYIPSLQALTHAGAVALLRETRLSPGDVSSAYDPVHPAGSVISQSPGAGGAVAPGSSVNFVLSKGSATDTPPVAAWVDVTVAPQDATVPALADGVPRLAAGVINHLGVQTDFVEDELILIGADVNAATALADRWTGEVVQSIAGQEELPAAMREIHLVRIRSDRAAPAALPADLRAIHPYMTQGDYRVSSVRGLQTLAAAAEEYAGGVKVAVNWVMHGDQFLDGSTTECDSATSTQCAPPFTPDAFTWPYMSQGSVQDIGVAAAWQSLEQHQRLTHRVEVLILDGGMVPNDDFPEHTVFGQVGVPNPATCTGGSACPWHGTQVTTAGFAVPDNGIGVAGPGGPVANLTLVPSPSLSGDVFSVLGNVMSYIRDAALGLFTMPQIINISAGVNVDAGWCLLGICELFDSLMTQLRAFNGALVFASAGNEGNDLDAEDCFLWWCWEGAVTLPCEADTVLCVGGLAENSTRRDYGSNYGHKLDAAGVDIYGPYTVWTFHPGVDPNHQLASVRRSSGTSFSSPFVAGVAALIWAADPSLAPFEVEALLLSSAHTDSTHPHVHRWVDAYTAVCRAIGLCVPPPEARSHDSPALVLAGSTLSIAWVGTNWPGRLRWIASPQPGVWEDKAIIDDGTHPDSDYGPSITFFNGRYYIAWTSTDASHPYIHLMRSTDATGAAWGDHIVFDETGGRPSAESSDRPMLYAGNGRLHVVWVGSNQPGKLRWIRSADGVTWGDKRILDDDPNDGVDRASYKAPSLAYFGGRYYLAWTGTDASPVYPRIHLLRSTDSDGGGWTHHIFDDSTNWPEAKTSDGPALYAGNGRLHLTWVGTDGPGRLRWVTTTDGLLWGDKRIIDDGKTRLSWHAPALVFHDGRYAMAWTSSDNPEPYLRMLFSTDATGSSWGSLVRFGGI